jgi:flavin-dependent dehydrogenase
MGHGTLPARLNTTHDLIVVGGGPGGSSAAAIAARAGLSVLLLEADKHPRVHVGESLLPGIIPILERMGALAEIERAGFTSKTGSTHWGWGLTPAWDLWFSDSELFDHAWLVDRSRFDDILFRTAARCGAVAREHTAVKSFLRDGDRVAGVTWRSRGDDTIHEARAAVTIDASGQAALLARELGLRSHIPGLQHEASWAHFDGSGRLPPPRDRQALFVAEKGCWIWHFPLGEGRASVGIIRLETANGAADDAFDAAIQANAQLMGVLGAGARRITPIRRLLDWSYRVASVTGPGFLLVGDASGFIDPVLSTGVHLAMHAGFHAATLVAEIVKKGKPEEAARAEYQAQHAALFGDLLRIVRFFYQQNLHREDYFWESKRILLDASTEIRPQRAFMVLTSGLVRNLALEDRLASLDTRRVAAIERAAAGEQDPGRLGFVCFHLRYAHGKERVALYFLIEPIEKGAPTLFRTLNFHLNCLAPRFKNDPINVPALAPYLRGLGRVVGDLDTQPGESLAAFWRRNRGAISECVRSLPAFVFELVRVFGE